MTHLIVSAPARPVSRTLATLAAAALAICAASPVIAQQQQPAPKPAAPAKPAPKPQAKPAQPAQQQGQAAAPQQDVQLIYSPWTKFCGKAQDANAKQICFTGKDARIESGMPVVAAVIIEPEGDPKKILRVTLPLGMQLQPGTRVIVDTGQPATGPYVICFANGCMADYEASPDMIGKLKKGQQLVVQAINASGQPVSLTLPLQDFAKAYDGPPMDPKVFEEQQKKLQEELQRRANEARQKLESQQGGQAAAGQAQQPGKKQ
jgi:invasion protein IalB